MSIMNVVRMFAPRLGRPGTMLYHNNFIASSHAILRIDSTKTWMKPNMIISPITSLRLYSDSKKDVKLAIDYIIPVNNSINPQNVSKTPLITSLDPNKIPESNPTSPPNAKPNITTPTEPSKKNSKSNPAAPTSNPTVPHDTKDCMSKTTTTNKSTTDSSQVPDVKLPDREQIEKFLFRTTVIIWDITVYLYAVLRKLFEQYVMNNPTVKQYWSIFMKKMDDARKEMKPK